MFFCAFVVAWCSAWTVACFRVWFWVRSTLACCAKVHAYARMCVPCARARACLRNEGRGRGGGKSACDCVACTSLCVWGPCTNLLCAPIHEFMTGQGKLTFENSVGHFLKVSGCGNNYISSFWFSFFGFRQVHWAHLFSVDSMRLLVALFAATLCASNSEATKLSPITRVVELLKNIGEKIEKELKEEENLYESYVCWG